MNLHILYEFDWYNLFVFSGFYHIFACTRYFYIDITTLIISKKPGNTGISRDIRTEFTTDLLLSD